MSNFGKGIPLASGFDLGAKAPLDSRITVQNIQERDAHVTNNRAYEGLRVYVVDENCEYLWNGNEWILIPSKQYVDDAIANVKISDEQLANYATKDEIPTKTSQLENDTKFTTESFVTNKIAEAQLQQGEIDLNGYQTKEDTTLETTNKTIVGAINEVNTNVMSKANKSDIPTKTSQLTNDSNFLTSIPSEYVTESELNAKGYLTEHQDISGKADKSEIPTKTSQLQNDSDFATNASVDEKIANASTGGTVDLSSYAKKTDLPTKTSQLTNDSGFITEHQDISDKADKSEIPTKTSQLQNDSGYLTSVPSEYVTETELEDKGYLTEHQDLSKYALKTEIPSVPTKTSQLTNDSGYLTSVPSEYITETELNEKGYLTEHQDISNKANKSEIPTKTSQLTNDNGFITTIPSEYITESELSTELSTKADISDIPSLDGYATETYVTNKIAEAQLSGEEVDLSGYATKDELKSKANIEHTHTMSNITDLVIPDVDKEYVDTQLNTKANKSDIPNLDGYALKTDIPTVPTKVSDFTNDSGYITEVPSEYITEIELNEKGYLTEHQDISNKADKSEIPTKTSQLANDSGFITEHQDISGKADKLYVDTELSKKSNTNHTHDQYLTEHQDLSNYALKTELPSVPTKTSQLTNDSGFITSVPSEYVTETELEDKGYLTEHQDISGKADKSEIPLENSVKMIAHRGFSSGAPENTLVAYKLAGMRGYWGAECDIQQTSDGHFILMHDETVDRTTNGTGTVSEMTLEQIKALTVKIKPGYYEPIPTLEEYLICCKQYNIVPIIEIKASINVTNFIQIIRDYGMEDKVVVISFNNDILISLRNLSNIIKIQTLKFVSIEHCLQYNFDIDIDYQNEWVTKENIKIAHNNNIEVNVWTVDDLAARNSLIARGVDYITTNVLSIDVCEGNRLYKVEQTSLSAVEKASLNLFSSMKIGQSDLEPIRLDEFMFTISERRNGEYNNVGTRTTKIVSKPIATLGCYHYKVEFDNTLCIITLHPRNKNNVQITDLGWFSTNGIYKLPSNTTHFFIYCGRVDDSEIPFTDEEIDRIKSSIKITRVYHSSENDVVHIPSNIRYAADHPEPISTIGTNIGNDTNGTRCFTNIKYNAVSRRVKVNFDSSLIKLTIASASSTDVRLADIGWLTNDNEYNLPDGVAWFYMYFAPVDGTSFTNEQKLAVANTTVTSIIFDKPLYQSNQDNALTTEDKTIVGAINELNSEVSDLNTNINEKANKSEIPTKTSQLTNDSGFITEHQNISGKADKSYVDTELAKKSDKTHAHSYNDLSDKPAIPSVDGLATKKELTDGLATKSDKTHTHDQYLTEHQDLSDYALKTELPTVPTKASQLQNDKGYITEIPSEYITETELSAKGYLTEHQDISGKVDKINGKGLSTNDYTTEEKNKLNGIEENANNYSLPIASSTVLGGIKIGSGLSIDSNGVLSSNGGSSDLSNYQTKTDNTLTTTDKTIVGAINELDIESIKAEDFEDSSVVIDNNLTSRVSALETNKADVSSIPTTLPANGGNSDTVSGFSIWVGTQVEYDAITTKSSTTLYFIREV